MKIYLAARYSRIDELNVYKQQLEAKGYTVTSRWLLGGHQAEEVETQQNIDGTGDYPNVGGLFAQEDLADLRAADLVISFTERPRSNHSRGGRHVEFGLALAWGKRLIIVGPRENVFYCLPEVVQYSTWPDLLLALGGPEIDLLGADIALR